MPQISLRTSAESHQILRWKRGNRGIMITSSMALILKVVLAFLTICSEPTSAFPDGAPGETCSKHKPNHGGTAQPLSSLPFYVTASSSTYEPGQTIAVKIAGKTGTYFKGFFIQASDDRGRWIGTFDPTEFSVSHNECAMTTHHDNHEKEEVTLLWRGPKDYSGPVRFLASILKNYKVYWVDVPAATPESKPTKTVVPSSNSH